ncbi:reverse transcriptase domain-containing protein [Tanacetum coccineum]
MMADQCTMAELLQAPTEGYGDAIVNPAILAENFELKHDLLNLVTSKRFYGFEKEDPHAHIHLFNKITSMINTNAPSSSTHHSSDITALIDVVKAMLHQKSSPPASVKAIDNTVANSRGDLNAITTRSGISYDGPPFPPLPKVVEREPEETKITVATSTKTVSSPDSPYNSSSLKSPLELQSELSFTNALLRMLKFASMFKSLLNNKEKLFDLAKTSVNENCLVVILKKLPEKLGDSRKFLIPCDFPELVECLALADLGANINLMPLSIWKKLSLPELTPTQMILKLADRSTTSPSGITKDVFVKVGMTARALIDVYGEELTLRVDDEAITFKVGQTSRYSYNDDVSINQIDVIDVACEEYAKEVLGFLDSSTSGNPTSSLDPILSTSSPSLTAFEEGIDNDDFDLEGDLLLLEKLLNDDPSSPLPPKELHVEELKIVKSSIDDPLELELKDLPSHLEYAFLEGTDKLPIIISKDLKVDEKGNEYYYFLDGFSGYFQIPIDLQDQEKTTFTCPYRTFAYRCMPFDLCNASGTFQGCMMAIFHDMIEETIEGFMDDFSVFGDSFSSCLSHLDKMLKRCEDTNLVLNWEKCHFMVKEGIVLGHKISKSGIEVDKAKVDVIAKLPHLTSVKGIEFFRSWGGLGLLSSIYLGFF